MDIRIFTLGPFQTNGYLLTEGTEAVFIDPGDHCPELLALLDREQLSLERILITHLHSDHFYGAARLAALTGADIYASADDGFMVEAEIRESVQWGYPPMTDSFSFTPIASGTHKILGRQCQVLKTPGHTRGGLTFYFADDALAFVGDLIFRHSIGRTDFTGGDYATLVRSIETVIFPLPDETVLYSGHGPSTTVGEEVMYNPHFKS